MLHQEAVQTPRSRCGVVVLAMLLLVAISIGHQGCVPQLKDIILSTKQLHIWKTQAQPFFGDHSPSSFFSKTVGLDSLLASPHLYLPLFQGTRAGYVA